MSLIHDPTSARTWQNSVLWQKLSSCNNHDTSEVVTLLQSWMPEIEAVLKHGGSSPTDFTLHDEEHAHRVAERMAEIIPAETLDGLCPYELAFLLLSAYLHDIGMTPESRKVSLHYQYLVTGNSNGLADVDVAEFQAWLDNDQQGLTPPLCTITPTADDLRRANRLVAHYCRHRHNDWSADWIRTHCPKATSGNARPLGTFDDWVDEVIRLCRSHHFGWDELISDGFNPRLVGNPGQVLHMRYLACVLRVADVLEFDPERTPEVVLAHRDISPESIIFWHKDHGVSPRLEDGRLILFARPAFAWLYRAVEEMLDQIDHELNLCRTLADQTHFENCPGLREPLPHHWKLTTSVYRDVKPKPDTFVYINSAFRPNTEKLLQIFSGIELYGNPLAAVRELLQNAFDAIREQVAYQRLRCTNPENSELEAELGRRHRVELRLERRPDGYWLVCTDTGVGMNKQIIENYLLVSGQARRHSLADLERRCRKAGFTTGRTGQFGIGVLSYFMIADRLHIATRRSTDAKDADPHGGWTFETEGIGSWGELRPSPTLDVGSRVELHLKENVLPDAAQWFGKLSAYLQESLVRIPCEFQLNSSVVGSEPLLMLAGWTRQEGSLDAVVINQMRHQEWRYATDPTPEHLLPQKMQQDVAERDQRWGEVRARARKYLRWIHDEGDLPNRVGKYRIHLPYFELPGGLSLVFFDVEQRNGENLLSRVGKGITFLPTAHALISWKGMAVAYNFVSRSAHIGLQFEVDFHDDSTASLAVSRTTITPTEIGIDCLKTVDDRGTNIIRDFVVRNTLSSYTSINTRRAGIENLALDKPQWVTRQGSSEQHLARWGLFRFPAIDSRVFSYLPLPGRVLWKNSAVSVLPCVAGPYDDRHYEGIAWDYGNLSPHRILCLNAGYFSDVAPLWERMPSQDSTTIESTFRQSKFPNSWKGVAGIAFHFHTNPIWNRQHKLVRVVSEEAWRWARANQEQKTDPLNLRPEVVVDRTKAAAWILRMIELGAKDLWCGLIEREPAFLATVWNAVFPAEKRTVTTSAVGFWVADSTSSRLRVVSPKSWDVYSSRQHGDRAEIDRWMPSPGPDWSLFVEWKREADVERQMFTSPRIKLPLRNSVSPRRKPRARMR